MKISRCWFLFSFLGLAWSLPAGSVTIKNVQSGKVTMSAAVVSQPITSVNTANTFVVCQNRQNNSNNDSRATCELTNSTTLTITKGANVADAAETVRYYVVEFSSGVTVQRGLARIDLTKQQASQSFDCPPNGVSGGDCVLSPAVGLSTSFVITSERIDANEPINNTTDEQWTVRGQFPATCADPCGLLEIQRNAKEASGSTSNPAIWIAWQVVTITDSAIQQKSGSPLPVSGNSAISGSSLSSAPTINAGVTKTFVVFSMKGFSTGTGVEARYRVRCALCAGALCSGTSTAITCTRTSTTGSEAETVTSWAVVMTDCSTTVQSGNVTLGAGTPSTDVTINPVVVANSVVFISVSGGVDPPAAGGYLNDTSVTACIGTGTDCGTASTTKLHLERQTSVTAVVVSWFVVNFGGASGTVIDQVESVP